MYLLVHFDCYVIVLSVYPSYGPPGGADLQAFVGVRWGTNFAPKAANRWKKKCIYWEEGGVCAIEFVIQYNITYQLYC